MCMNTITTEAHMKVHSTKLYKIFMSFGMLISTCFLIVFFVYIVFVALGFGGLRIG